MNQLLDPISWLPLLLQTTDSAYPIGGFAHSGGLEGMVALNQVRNAEELHAFLRQEVTDTLTFVELPLLYHAWKTTTDVAQPILGSRHQALAILDETSDAIRFAAEQRQASRRLGSQRLALLQKLHLPNLTEPPQTFLNGLSQTLPHKHLCIIAGIEAAVLGTPVAAAMMALAHQAVMMVAQAAMKLMRIGQNSVQAMVADMAPRYAAMIACAQQLSSHELGTCLPRLDIATAYHETAPARMFLS
jgi:urease accessory protein